MQGLLGDSVAVERESEDRVTLNSMEGQAIGAGEGPTIARVGGGVRAANTVSGWVSEDQTFGPPPATPSPPVPPQQPPPPPPHAPVIETLGQLSAHIDALAARVDALEAQNACLRAKVTEGVCMIENTTQCSKKNDVF